MMKVHFISPPPLDGKPVADRIYGCNYGFYPLPNIFVLYCATLLQKHGYEVEVTDCPVDGISKPEQFYKFIDRDKSDVYVFYSVFLTRETDNIAAKYIQDNKGDVAIIFMGSDPTYDPSNYLTHENRYVIRGEPELTLLELIRTIENKSDIRAVKGVSYFKEGEILHNEMRPLIKNLDVLPIPDRKLLKNPDKYYNPKLTGTPQTVMYTSRNCPFQCYYCVPCSLSFARELEYKRFYGRKPPVTFHSVRRVIKEFEEIYSEGYKVVSIIDDDFTLVNNRVKEICRGIIESGIKIKWSCLGRADQLLDEEMIKLMAEAGCTYVDIGAEHFCQEILDYVGKNLKVECIEKAIKLLKDYGIEPEINILFGASPLETEDTLKYTLNKVKELRKKYGLKYILFNVCSPFPGTEFYKLAKENKWMVYDDYKPTDGTKESQISYPHLSKEKLEYYLRKAYREHYFNPRTIISELISIDSWEDFKNKLKTALKLFKYYVLGFKVN